MMHITRAKSSYQVTMGRMLMAYFAVAILSPASQCLATIPYGSVTPGTPVIGPAVAPPSIVTGKEYSHDMDHIATAAGVSLGPATRRPLGRQWRRRDWNRRRFLGHTPNLHP